MDTEARRPETRSTGQLVARLLPLCVAMACQGETTTPTSGSAAAGELAAAVTDNVVASLAVIPDSQMVFVGDRFQVTARPKNQAGQVLDLSIRWTVSNTSVVTTVEPSGATMTFKGHRVGKTSVKATVGGKSRFSTVVVRGVSGAKVVVTPEEATVTGGATATFVAKGVTRLGETAGVNVTWTTAGGTISPNGDLVAGDTPGTYEVIATSAFGAADTAALTITGTPDPEPPDPVAAVFLVPETASLTVGETVQLAAYGRTDAGDSVPVSVSYDATGGTVSGGGLYTAGQAAGSYRVVATSAAGPADTTEVTVSAAGIDRVTLMPDIAASRHGETTRFVATVWNTLGNQVPEPVTFETTCGAVTGAGVFTAPQDVTGSCLVTASAGGKAATTEVVLLTSLLDHGVPFGIYDLWSSATRTQSSGVAAYTSSHDYMAPSEMVNHIATARAKGVRLVLAMTGGSHDRYKTGGVFDLAKWQGAMDGYNTQAIRDAVAEGVADGTIIGNSVMDEPHQAGTGTKAWGPAGTMTKARVDGLCAYVQGIFPTLPAGVGHDHGVFEPDQSYQVCDFLMAQYAARKGNVLTWRDAGLALTARDGMAIIFSINLLNGGAQDKTGTWDCAGTGGLGTFSPNCQVTPAQLRDWGKALGQSACALLGWRYESSFVAKPENQAAISDVAITLAGLPRTSCRGTR